MGARSVSLRAALFIALIGTTDVAFGQIVTVRGVAYDSVRQRGIALAFVTLGSRSSTTDTSGVFTIDSVAAGTYVLAVQHESLDSLGLAGLSRRVTITDGKDELRIAVPSFQSLWRATCGRPAPAADSGFVFGVVRDVVSGEAVAGASVNAAWSNVAMGTGTTLSQRRWNMSAPTDSSGGFALCGVPVDALMQIGASKVSARTDLIGEIVTPELRIRRRDLTLGAQGDTIAAEFGSIAGVVTNEAGRPIENARLLVADHPEVRSASDGRFSIGSVPSGTRQLEVLSLGTLPRIIAVDVKPHAVTEILVTLSRGHTLDTVRVNANSARRNIVADIEDRRKSGVGFFLDSTRISRQARLLTVFAEVPGVHSSGGWPTTLLGCPLSLWVDGFQRSSRDFDAAELSPTNVALIEVYAHASTVPTRFMGRKDGCGAVVIWTRRFMP